MVLHLVQSGMIFQKILNVRYKVYVDVLAEFSRDGLLISKEITWEDGRKLHI